MLRRLVTTLIIVTAAMVATAWQSASPTPFGFTSATARTYLALESKFLDLPSPDRIRDAHLHLSAKPHVAGSARDRELAEWTADRFREYGLDDVQITTHEVMLPLPEETTVEMLQPQAWRASMREEPLAGDPYTQISEAEAGLPYHAYSASG